VSLASSMPVLYMWMVPLGLLVGAFGTLIGAGGGFILAPLLFLAFPKESPEVIASISLAVVFVNALSGSVAYARMGRIHYPSGLFFAAAGIPGAILGAIALSFVSRSVFGPTLSLILIAVALYLLVKPVDEKRQDAAAALPAQDCAFLQVPEYNRTLGGGVSFFVGGVSSLLGICGGIIHVPFMARVLRFPTHTATATSHFVLAIMALTGTLVHIGAGEFHSGWRRTLLLGCGVMVGAQIGAMASTRVRSEWIIRCLAVALLIVGVRVLLN
jgi:uncharacterized protein